MTRTTMRTSATTFFVALLLFVVGTSTALVGQEPGAGAVTTADPSIPIADLEDLFRAPTADQLAIEVEAWQALLRDKIAEIAAANIENRAVPGDQAEQKAAIRERVTTLSGEKANLQERFSLAIAAFEKKGGDGTAYRSYRDAVSGAQIDTKDAAATTHFLKDWLMAKDGGILYGKNLLVALLIIMAFMILSRILARLTTAALTRSRLDVSLGLKRFFSGMVKKFTVLFGFILALSMIGIDIGPFVAALGVGGFVLGFALQETLGNFAAGILILMYRPFEIGHVVSAAGVTGKVEDISLVSTTFKTPDNQTIVVPNGSVWGGVITNITGQKERRVDLVFGIGYDDDIAKAEAVLGELVKAHPQVLSDPKPVIKVNELADSSVNFVVRPWAKTEDYWDVKFDLTRQVKERFDAEGISIPFPQRDVHLHQVQG